jgi:hypothetical protein
MVVRRLSAEETNVEARTQLHFEQLDTASATERDAYERAFFACFHKKADNRWIRSLWDWNDDEREIRTRVPYEDQAIYVLRREDGSVAMGLSANVAMRTFQSAAHGFPVPTDTRGCCELLALFGDDRYDLERSRYFLTKVAIDLRSRGFHTGYATAASRWTAYYARLVFATVLETRTIDDATYCFLKIDLTKLGGIS